MTTYEYSRLQYIRGRMEGISCGCGDQARNALLDTCEMLAEVLDSMDVQLSLEEDDNGV